MSEPLPVKMEQLMSLIPKDYQTDIATETVLKGDELRNGMMVLIWSQNAREDVKTLNGLPEHILERALETNHWCEISNVQIDALNPTASPMVTFTGLYSDGTTRKRKYSLAYDWIVKRNSIPEKPVPTVNREEKLNLVFDLLGDFLLEHELATNQRETFHAREAIANKIVNLFE